MIKYKTKEEIQLMAESGRILRETVQSLKKVIRPGIKTKEIDDYAEVLILKKGAKPSFKTVDGYNWTTCLPVNEEIVHSPPSERRLKNGDLLTVDIGVLFKGFHTDYAETFVVGKLEKNESLVKRFLTVGKITLEKAIEKLKIGHFLGEVSKKIEEEIGGNGYFVIKELTGHGIGRQLHEEPFVLGYLDRPINKTLLIKSGLVLAIEIIYSLGTSEMIYDRNNHWIIKTKDNSLSACFEKTVAVLDKKTVILT